jgi:hypothetical protein
MSPRSLRPGLGLNGWLARDAHGHADGMIDRFAAAGAGPPYEAEELGAQAVIIRKLDLAV